jgi:hypothetical protein
MGRGRAKAKQTKVARKLKYFSPDTDLSALEQELHSSTQQRYGALPADIVVDDEADDDEDVDDEDDGYASWATGSH